jgi:L-alanine-DL-glutamate epimerase-like enolase superfamily enzyme
MRLSNSIKATDWGAGDAAPALWGIIDRDGMIRLPERPGLGIELDHGAVERYRSQ